MNEEYVRKRIDELRIKKGVSEYRMSTDMGHSKGYIQSISSGRALPSMSEFLFMCEYLGVTPREFFDEEISQPAMINEISEKLKRLNEKDMKLILDLIDRFSEQ